MALASGRTGLRRGAVRGGAGRRPRCTRSQRDLAAIGARRGREPRARAARSSTRRSPTPPRSRSCAQLSEGADPLVRNAPARARRQRPAGRARRRRRRRSRGRPRAAPPARGRADDRRADRRRRGRADPRAARRGQRPGGHARSARVDAAILGGVIVRVGDRLIDAVRARPPRGPPPVTTQGPPRLHRRRELRLQPNEIASILREQIEKYEVPTESKRSAPSSSSRTASPASTGSRTASRSR